MSKLTIAAASAFIAASLFAGPAQALPAADLATATVGLADLQQAGWVCGPYRCWQQPDYSYYDTPLIGPPRDFYPPPYASWRSWYGPGYDFNSGYPQSRHRRAWW